MASNTRTKPSSVVSQTETQVINVKFVNLRILGYNNLEEWLKNPNHVYIGKNNQFVKGAKKSKWAKSFPVEKYSRDKCMDLYEKQVLRDKDLMESLQELKGKTLGCWCAPEPCHGHVLQKLIAEHCG